MFGFFFHTTVLFLHDSKHQKFPGNFHTEIHNGLHARIHCWTPSTAHDKQNPILVFFSCSAIRFPLRFHSAKLLALQLPPLLLPPRVMRAHRINTGGTALQGNIPTTRGEGALLKHGPILGFLQLWCSQEPAAVESHTDPPPPQISVGLPHKTPVLQCGFSGSCCA